MTNQTMQINSEQQCSEMFSEPVHSPIVIGNETFIVTVQDQRIIVDRRNWFLSRIETCQVPMCPTALPFDSNLQAFIVQTLQQLNATATTQSTAPICQNGIPEQKAPYCFHYAKQTDTDDLPYYQRRDQLAREAMVVKHVHYYVECATKSKAVNTDESGQRIDDDPITDEEGMGNMWKQAVN